MTPPARRRGVGWLVLALVCLLLGAFLMRGTEPESKTPRSDVSLPKKQRGFEATRAAERATWTPPVSLTDAGLPAPPPPAVDPLLRALPADVKDLAVVVELNAVLNSELGQLLTACLAARASRGLSALQDAGIDVFRDFDRVGMTDDVLLLTGDFRNADWKRVMPVDAEQDWGPNAKLSVSHRRDGGEDYVGVWRQQVLVAGSDREHVTAALDRLDGKGSAGTALPASEAYGEVYGVIRGRQLAEMLEGAPELSSLLKDSNVSLRLHADVSRDVGMVADVDGAGQQLDDLRRALAGALSVARLKAKAEGKDTQAQVLDLAKVHGAEGESFRLEAGLPYALLEGPLRECVERERRRDGG